MQTEFKVGNIVTAKHYVTRKFGHETMLYTSIGIITEISENNQNLIMNIPDERSYSRTIDLNRVGNSDEFFDETTGIYSRLELIT